MYSGILQDNTRRCYRNL